MIKTFFIFCVFISSLASCNREPEIPKDVIPIKKMNSILWDVMQAEEFIMHKSTYDTTFNRVVESKQLLKQILNSHKVSADGFRQSMRFYQKRPDLLKIILDSVQRKADKAVIPPSSPTQVQ